MDLHGFIKVVKKKIVTLFDKNRSFFIG